jgi:predicted aspartyl protease
VRTIALALALPLLLVAAACSGGDAATGADTRPRVTTATVVETVEQEPQPAETVDLRVSSGDFGVLAFAEVFIAGKGPYAFTVDTGASHSVVDWDLARELELDVIGKPVAVTGITCRGQAGRIRMRGWRMGGVRLPRLGIQTIDMPDPGGGLVIEGLLGSDVLSRFGAVTVDYQAGRLFLDEAA